LKAELAKFMLHGDVGRSRGLTNVRAGVLLAAFSLAISCSNSSVTVDEGSVARRERVSELDQVGWVVRVRVSSSEYSKLRDGAYLFASDCRSYEPMIEVGFSIGTTTVRPMADGKYELRFVLDPNSLNQRISESWTTNLRCAYVRTTHNYSLTKYQSNIFRLR
jgi:hypothetical protein